MTLRLCYAFFSRSQVAGELRSAMPNSNTFARKRIPVEQFWMSDRTAVVREHLAHLHTHAGVVSESGTQNAERQLPGLAPAPVT